jgi:hypothetical protein
VSRTSLQLEADALSVPCTTHDVPADTECPDGGACMDRYGLSPQQWAGWFEPSRPRQPAPQRSDGYYET